MPIKFEHSGNTYEAETPEQVAWLIEWLDKRERDRVRADRYSVELSKVLRNLPQAGAEIDPWTTEVFDLFLSSLGEAQIKVLGTLVSSGTLEDDALRVISGVANNQALSGVLSGISKQATRLGLSPRDVFWIENIRKERRRRSVYHVSPTFRAMANGRGWPEHRFVW